MQIITLNSYYNGTQLLFTYESSFYYEALYTEAADSFAVCFAKKLLQSL